MPRRACLIVVLILLAAMTTGCTDAPAGGKAPGAAPWFTDQTDAAGIDFVHDAGATGTRMMPEIMGAGAALFDCDGDGDLDAYFTNGNGRLRNQQTPALTNRLYRQEAGGRFVDATDDSGLGGTEYGMGVAIADYDNDGDLDVFASNYGVDRLYRNRGNGVFDDVTEAAGIGDDAWSASAAFLDYDRDGDLDLYVTRYVAFTPGKTCFEQAGRRDYCGPKEFPPVHDLLWRNEGNGTFTDVSATAGMASVEAAGLGVVIDDFDDDGWIDVYVANDAYANQLWINRRDGTFTDDALLLGAAFNLNGQAEAGMGAIAADLDGDRDSDLYITHLGQETNTMYRNTGGTSGFIDDTGRSGLAAASMARTGFGAIAFDADGNGTLDLFTGNGRVFRGPVLEGVTLAPPWDEYAEPNLLHLNDGAGRFEIAADACGELCASMTITRGVVAGDVDLDGDLDVLIANIQGRGRLFRNDAPASGQWLFVRAIDPALNRDAVGARITVSAGGHRLARTVSGAVSYCSAGPMNVHFGLGAANAVDEIEVRWPDGMVERFPGGPSNQRMILSRGSGTSMTGSSS